VTGGGGGGTNQFMQRCINPIMSPKKIKRYFMAMSRNEFPFNANKKDQRKKFLEM